jgi:SLOG family YspA-like protein
MALPYRVLITGERDWTNKQQVFRAIENALKFYNADDVVIVHGDCPTGADKFAREYCELNRIKHEAHPADWIGHGTRAGPLRNAKMVQLGAVICLAFWSGLKTNGSGTFDCLTKAIKAGIRVVVYPRLA